MRIMQLPSNGIQDAGQAVLGDASAEERVRGKSAEGVVADLGVGRGGSLAHEIQIDVGADGRSVQEGQPDVYAQLGLEVSAGDRERQRGGGRYHAITVRWNAGHQNVVAQIVQARSEIASRRALEEEQVEVGHGCS